ALLECAQEVLLKFNHEIRASTGMEIDNGEDHNLILINLLLVLPNSSEGKVLVLRRQAAKTAHESPFNGDERFSWYRATIIECKGEEDFVPAGPFRTFVSCVVCHSAGSPLRRAACVCEAIEAGAY